MSKFRMNCPLCYKRIEADENMRGKVATCPCCKQQIIMDEDLFKNPNREEIIAKAIGTYVPVVERMRRAGIKQYKVLTKTDSIFTHLFNPRELEKALNELAKEGWRVVTTVPLRMNKMFGSDMDEVIIILERDI